MASVEPTRYPHGPSGFAVRLERSERGPIARSLARWTVPLGIILAALGLVLATRDTHPALFAVLAAVCICLSGLSLVSPAIYAWNERLTVYYIDRGWMAVYRGHRRDHVELGAVTEMKATALHNVSVVAGRQQLLLPVAAIRAIEVAPLIRWGLSVAGEHHAVHVDESVRALLQNAPSPSYEEGSLAGDALHPDPPPFQAWDAVRTSRRRPSRGHPPVSY